MALRFVMTWGDTTRQLLDQEVPVAFRLMLPEGHLVPLNSLPPSMRSRR